MDSECPSEQAQKERKIAFHNMWALNLWGSHILPNSLGTNYN